MGKRRPVVEGDSQNREAVLARRDWWHGYLPRIVKRYVTGISRSYNRAFRECTRTRSRQERLWGAVMLTILSPARASHTLGIPRTLQCLQVWSYRRISPQLLLRMQGRPASPGCLIFCCHRGRRALKSQRLQIAQMRSVKFALTVQLGFQII